MLILICAQALVVTIAAFASWELRHVLREHRRIIREERARDLARLSDRIEGYLATSMQARMAPRVVLYSGPNLNSKGGVS
jgi:hypothetical protein